MLSFLQQPETGPSDFISNSTTRRVACLVSAPDTGPSILRHARRFRPFLPFPAHPAPPREDRLMGAVVAPAAGRAPAVARPGPPGPASDHLASGHPALDARLPGGGWPASGLCEVLQAAPGVGELALVWPALARLEPARPPDRPGRPPYRPHAPAWAAAAGPGPVADHPRRAEAGTGGRTVPALCGLRGAYVLAAPGRRPFTAPAAGGCRQRPVPGLRVPRGAGRAQSLPASLRLQLDHGQVRVLKCRGGLPPAQPLPLAIAH